MAQLQVAARHNCNDEQVLSTMRLAFFSETTCEKICEVGFF